MTQEGRMTETELPEVMKVKHVKQHLDIGRKQAYELVGQEDFPSIRPNERNIRIPKDPYLEWLEEQAAKKSVS